MVAADREKSSLAQARGVHRRQRALSAQLPETRGAPSHFHYLFTNTAAAVETPEQVLTTH